MFDNDTKLCWRGWAWNQIAKRVRPGGVVVVLAGECAMDLPKARKHGFECVGVDIDGECVDTFREAGGVAVQDVLHRQLLAIRPDGVIADMMGGVTENGWNSFVSASVCGASGVVWNGLRGRDSGIGKFADLNREFRVPEFSTGRPRLVQIEKHRGKIIWLNWCLNSWLIVNGSQSDWIGGGGPKTVDISGFSDKFILELSKIGRPEYFSYRSKDSGQFFDSVAFSCLPGFRTNVVELANSYRCQRSRRKAAAAKALLTRRRARN